MKIPHQKRRRLQRRRALLGTLAAVGLVLMPLDAGVEARPLSLVRVVVQVLPDADAAAMAAAAAGSTGSVTSIYSSAINGFAAAVPESAVRMLEVDPHVLSVEVDGAVVLSDVQDLPPNWGLDRIDQASLPLDGTYSVLGTGAGVSIYVVDSGVRADHFDLLPRVADGFSVIADGVGTGDCNGHGTHVAGIAAGRVHGVAKTATIIPVRVVDCTGSGSVSQLIAGMDWIVKDHAEGSPAVVNTSLSTVRSPAVDAAARAVIRDGVTVVAAAGNDGSNACSFSPGRMHQAVTVGATTPSDSRAPYSNFGPCVDLFAPGSFILSDSPSSQDATEWRSGTSMASPHVAGAAALLLSRTPDAKPSEVAAGLLAGVTKGVVVDSGKATKSDLLRVG